MDALVHPVATTEDSDDGVQVTLFNTLMSGT
jgi:hypothetical protein